MLKERTKQLHQSVKPYTYADNRRSTLQIFNTILPLMITWTLGYLSVSILNWLALAFAIIAAGLLVRTFIIFYCCTHGSFYHDKKKNDHLGTITGALTSFPYKNWISDHSVHHASIS